MAGGKRYKFFGSLIQVVVDYHAMSPSLSITGITKANPPVVTVTNHGLSDGDIVYLDSVGGMTELNGEAFAVNVLTVSTFELVDTDATGYGTYTSGGHINPANLSNFCELTGYNRTGGTSPESDATSLCSTSAEYELGFPDFGSTRIDYNFAPGTAVQQAIESFYRSGKKVGVRVTLPNNGGKMVQMGFVQQTSEQVARGGMWSGSMTIRNTGPRYDIIT